MEIIRQILEKKGNLIHSVSPDTTVYDALKLMADKNTGAVLVLEGQKLCGIMSERDYARKIVLKGKSSKEVPVKDIMSSEVICIESDQRITNAQAIMIQKRIRHLPVLDKGELVGLVSIGDIVNAILDDNKFVIDQLFTYINGRPAPEKEYLASI